MTVTIKQVTEKDLSQLIKISRETFVDTFGKDNTQADMVEYLEQSFSTAEMKQELSTNGTNFWFIFVDDQIAGYLKLNIDQAQSDQVANNALEIERIYIQSAFKRHGLGTKLYHHAETVAHDQHCDNMWLGVWEHNQPAQRFYQGLGFKQIGDHVFTLGSDVQRDLIMLKKMGSTIFGTDR
ncbi:GNAT family N-acetyltransferase, partial [Paucilactobacillus suebicus]